MNIPPGAPSHQLQLPVWNALYQIRDFPQYINWIRAENPTGKPLPLAQLDKSSWQVAATLQGAVVTYEMFTDNSDPYGAQLNSHHAFFNLAEILMYDPQRRSSRSSIELRNVPSGWKIAVPLTQHDNGFFADNYDQLVDSPVEISNFEEKDFAAKCGHYRVVLDRETHEAKNDRGDSAAILSALVPQLQRIVEAACTWMNDCPFQNYMFIYHASESPAGGGMEHSFSTAITLPEKDFEDVSGSLLNFTSHEFFHLWNVKRIRPQSLEPVDYTKENYTPALWFSEGVDSTAGEYILLHAGLLEEKPYLEHLSREMTELQNRPAHRTQSVEQSSMDAWLEKYPYYGLPDRSISYYNKGELLGVLLDLSMRQASDDRESLRDLFRWMNEHYAKRGKFFADSGAIREAAETISHADLREFFQNYVAGTEEIPWNNFFAYVGLRVIANEVTAADPEFAAVQKFDRPPVVVEVEANSDAQRAGLVPDDVIRRINGKSIGRDYANAIAQLVPGQTLSLVVGRNGRERTLSWKLGVHKETAFQLQDAPSVSAQQRQRRTSWLFGRGENGAQ